METFTLNNRKFYVKQSPYVLERNPPIYSFSFIPKSRFPRDFSSDQIRFIESLFDKDFTTDDIKKIQIVLSIFEPAIIEFRGVLTKPRLRAQIYYGNSSGTWRIRKTFSFGGLTVKWDVTNHCFDIIGYQWSERRHKKEENKVNKVCVSRSTCAGCAENATYNWHLLSHNPEWKRVDSYESSPKQNTKGGSFGQTICYSKKRETATPFWSIWQKENEANPKVVSYEIDVVRNGKLHTKRL